MALVEVNPGSGPESKAQRCLAGALPSDWIVTTNIQSHNFEDWGLSGRGDADSIVISPRGIFVLEFKNWRGASIIPNKNKAWVVDGAERKNPFPQGQAKRYAIKDLFKNFDRRFDDDSLFQYLIVLTHPEGVLDWSASDIRGPLRSRVALLDQVPDRIREIEPREKKKLHADLVRKALQELAPAVMPAEVAESWAIRPSRSHLEIKQVVEGIVEAIQPDQAIIGLRGIDYAGELELLRDGEIKGMLREQDVTSRKLKNPLDLLRPGQGVRAQIVGIGPDTQEISLGIKQLEAVSDPVGRLKAGHRATARVLDILADHARLDLGGVFGTLSFDERSYFDEHASVTLNERIRVVVTRNDRERRDLLVRELHTAAFADLQVGLSAVGEVSRITAKGAEVDLGPIKGWLPAAEMTWRQGPDPAGLLTVPRQVRVKILSTDPARRRVTLSLKQRRPDPLGRLKTGAPLGGRVRETTAKGAVVDLGGIDGWLAAADITWRQLPDPVRSLSLGQRIQVQIIRIDQAKREVVVGAKQLIPDPFGKLRAGIGVHGRVSEVTAKGAVIDLGDVDGWLPAADVTWRQVRDPARLLSVGQLVKVKINHVDPSRREIVLGMKQLEPDPLRELQAGISTSGRVSEISSKGAVIDLGTINGWLPAADITWRQMRDPTRLLWVSQRAKVRIARVDRVTREVALEMKQLRPDPLGELQAGIETVGRVSEITAHGAVLDLGDVDGWLPAADITWRQVPDPSRLLLVGQRVKVKIIQVDSAKRRIALGMKQLQPDPVCGLQVGASVTACVSEIGAKGALVDLGRIDGWLPAADISWRQGSDPAQLLSIGQWIPVQILRIDAAKREIAVGMKQLQPDPLSKLRAGTCVFGRVSGVAAAGAVIDLGGINAWLPATDMRLQPGSDPAGQFPVGKKLKAKIIHIDSAKRAVSLAVEQVRPDPLLRLNIGDRLEARVGCIFDDHLVVDLGGVFARLPATEIPGTAVPDSPVPRPVATPVMSLKKSVEPGVVRQSFGHGRSKQVVVERVKHRRLGRFDLSFISLNDRFEVKIIKLDRATRYLEVSRTGAIEEESRHLADVAEQHIQAGDYATAVAVALEAFKRERKAFVYVPEAEQALLRACANLRELAVLDAHSAKVTSVAFSDDGKRIATGSLDGTAQVWDAETFARVGSAMRHLDGVVWVAFSCDGRRILTVSGRGRVRVWDAIRGEPVVQLGNNKHIATSAAFSRDGKRVVTAARDGAQIWYVKTRRPIGAPLRHNGAVLSAAFSPDGVRVVTASQNSVRIWDAASQQQIGPRIEGGATSAAFSADGRCVLIASRNRTRILDAETRAQIAVLEHEGEAGIAFDPDGTRVLTIARGKSARIWHIANHAEIAVLADDGGSVTCAAFSPDGSRAVTGTFDERVRVWDVQIYPQAAAAEACTPANPAGKRVLIRSAGSPGRTWHAYHTPHELIDLARTMMPRSLTQR